MTRLDTFDALRASMRDDDCLQKCLERIIVSAQERYYEAEPRRYVYDVIDEVAFHLWKCGRSAAKEE